MSEFLIDINPDIELPKYELVLTKLNEEPISSLKNITNIQHKSFFVGIDELNFNIPYYRTENNGDKVKNEIYDLVEGDHLILVNDMKYFIIYSISEKANEENGEIYKEVSCYSREYELSHKKLVDYKADSRVLYDSSNSMLDGLEKGVLNYIFKYITKAWTIGYVDPTVILKEGKTIHRSLDFSNSNLLQVFQELQKTFGCIFKFDTIGQKINIFSIEKMMGQHRGLYISDGNFIKNISKSIKSDEIKTRLYLYGKDNVSIQGISPTGQPYIDNFTFYKNTKYMSQGLIDALNAYENKVIQINPNFSPLFVALNKANDEMEVLKNADSTNTSEKGLIALERELSIVQSNIDVQTEALAIKQSQIDKATGDELSMLYNERKAIQILLDGYNTEKSSINNLIGIKKEQISNKQTQIDGIQLQIKTLQDELNVSNSSNFTSAQIKELDKFIKVETYNNSDYTEDNIQELYEEGKKILQRISQPPIQFDVDVVDFLNVIECQHSWDKLVLGDIVTLEHEEIGFNYDVKLVSIEHNIDDNDLNLKFSSKNSFDDATLYLQELLEDFKTTGTVVDFNKDKWEQIGDVESHIAKLVDSKLEEARQNILNAVGQRYLFDDSGLWLYKENPDGTIDPCQIRGINSDIALTDDNFTTVKTAISAKDGINAELIRGKLGQFAKVSADQLEVGANGETIPENLVNGLPYIKQQTNELNTSVNGLGNKITNAFSDNYITNIEANSLDLARNSVVKEAEDVKNIAISLSISTTAITAAINSLNIEVNKYVGKPSYPISITSASRTSMTNVFTALESAIAQLYKSIDEKRDSNTRGYIDQQTKELNTSVSQLEGNINKFGKDLILTATEAQTIKIDLERVTYESTDIINIAIGLSITTEKDNYIAALNTLTNYLNMNWLNATYPLNITQVQINNVSTHFKYLDDRKTKLINKISAVREQNSKSYTDRQVSEFDSAVTDLQNNINDFSSDGKLTLAEANSIKLSLDSVNAEATDLINIATSLSIVTEKNNYSTALSTLTNYLNTNWLGKVSYPITVTPTQRTNVSNYFKDVENRKSILVNKISEKRDSNTRAFFQVTTDAITGRVTNVETDTQNLDTRISSAEQKITPSAITNTVNSQISYGNIDVEEKIFKQGTAPPHKSGRLWLDISKTPEILYRSNGSTWYRCSPTSASDLGINLSSYATKSEVTQTANDVRFEFTNLRTPLGGNAIIESGVTKISKDGIRVTHSGLGRQYSEMRADGFIRKWEYGEASYLNDIWVKSFELSDGAMPEETVPPDVYVQLPLRMKGRTDMDVILAVSENSMLFNTRVSYWWWESINLYCPPSQRFFSASTPYLKVTAHRQVDNRDAGRNWYKPISFQVIVIGK